MYDDTVGEEASSDPLPVEVNLAEWCPVHSSFNLVNVPRDGQDTRPAQYKCPLKFCSGKGSLQ